MKYVLIPILFVSAFSFSQNKEYSFDYLLEYEITFHKEDVSRPKYYLTNSKDNSYLGIMKETDSLHFELTFKHYDKIYAKVTFLKSDFFKAEYLNIGCRDVSSTIKKIKIKDTVLESLKDTLIDGTSYFIHKLELKKKPKKVKKKKGLVTKYYIINRNSINHLPLLEDIYDYKRWVKYRKMPNGIYNQQIQINLLNQSHASEILKSYHKIDKKVAIVGKCLKPRKHKLPH
ncbi:hypothetical protein MWU58_02370 [Flavobacteriaceae bacterium S0825]|uniref:hypothetical protein n=1 Tax=Gaetbulibacter sp. S0825 TaxID=2720084 RepID=UPI00142FE01F|nr:hypothetical protein [Gaetbulibacter sp. S0825]MCK0108131.1 hypothetical protein [Flavobacteriaceae bacterium S0825]NIX63767.1 hypothetical protein [Gaetbulibacter sp. S0825]